MSKINGAQMLFKSLEAEGVDTIFGLPGGAFKLFMMPYTILRLIMF